MEEKKLSPKALFVWRGRATAFFTGCAFVTGGIFVFNSTIALILGSIALLLYLFLILIYYPNLYKNYRFSIENGDITVKKGVFVKKKLTLNSGRIQYVEFAQSPLEKKFKIYTVIFHCAGSGVILSHVTAEDIAEIKKV